MKKNLTLFIAIFISIGAGSFVDRMEAIADFHWFFQLLIKFAFQLVVFVLIYPIVQKIARKIQKDLKE